MKVVGALLGVGVRSVAVFLSLWLTEVVAAWLCVGWSTIGVFFSPGSATVLLGTGEFALWAALSGFLPAAAATLVLLVTVGPLRGRLLRTVLGWPTWTVALGVSSVRTAVQVYLGEGSGGTWSPLDHLIGAVLPASPALVVLAAMGALLSASVLPERRRG